jgi:hypothetical protein
LDYLTVDGTGVNKYDFFDSDDLDKSTAGTIFKTIATIIPAVIGSKVRLIYGGYQVVKELV